MSLADKPRTKQITVTVRARRVLILYYSLERAQNLHGLSLILDLMHGQKRDDDDGAC